jgi:hypothetical protein
VIRSVARAALFALAGLVPAPLAAQEVSTPSSLDRLRAQLERTPKLTLQTRTPDFRVHIEKRRPMQDIFDVPAWATDPIGWQPPGVGLDLSMVFRYLAAVKRGHDERRARDEVQRAIADYCAAQPADDRPASAARICGAPSPIR